jgi:hypothetical protein
MLLEVVCPGALLGARSRARGKKEDPMIKRLLLLVAIVLLVALVIWGEYLWRTIAT